MALKIFEHFGCGISHYSDERPSWRNTEKEKTYDLLNRIWLVLLLDMKRPWLLLLLGLGLPACTLTVGTTNADKGPKR